MTGQAPRDEVVTHHAASHRDGPTAEAEHRARNESLGEMFSSFSRNLSDLMRQEVQLAKAEATQSVVWAIIAAVLASAGKKRLDNMKGLPQTQDTIGDIPPTLNPNKETP